MSHIRPYFQRPLGIVFGNKSVIYVDDPITMEQFFNAPECIDKSFFQDGFCLKRGILHAKGNMRKHSPLVFNNDSFIVYIHPDIYWIPLPGENFTFVIYLNMFTI